MRPKVRVPLTLSIRQVLDRWYSWLDRKCDPGILTLNPELILGHDAVRWLAHRDQARTPEKPGIVHGLDGVHDVHL